MNGQVEVFDTAPVPGRDLAMRAFEKAVLDAGGAITFRFGSRCAGERCDCYPHGAPGRPDGDGRVLYNLIGLPSAGGSASWSGRTSARWTSLGRPRGPRSAPHVSLGASSPRTAPRRPPPPPTGRGRRTGPSACRRGAAPPGRHRHKVPNPLNLVGFKMNSTYTPPPRLRTDPPRLPAGGKVDPPFARSSGGSTRRARAVRPAAPPGPKLAVRALPRGIREASLALVEYAVPGPDRCLPEKAADFVTFLAGGGARVLHAEGVDVVDPAAGSHTGFTALAEVAGESPAELETLVAEQARNLLGDDFKTV